MTPEEIIAFYETAKAHATDTIKLKQMNLTKNLHKAAKEVIDPIQKELEEQAFAAREFRKFYSLTQKSRNELYTLQKSNTGKKIKSFA